MAYALVLAVLVLLEKEGVFLAVLSLGVGSEFNLVAFQVRNGTYCPYCLTFAAILVFLLLFNWRRSRLPLMGVAATVGFFVCLLFFKGAATPVYAEEVLLPTFGTGKVQVRLYGLLLRPLQPHGAADQTVLRDLVHKTRSPSPSSIRRSTDPPLSTPGISSMPWRATGGSTRRFVRGRSFSRRPPII